MVAFRVRPLLRHLASALGVVALAGAFVAATFDTADARKRQRGGYAPPYASIVVDVKTGRTLQGTNADALRHPASVTKVMTLYMLFEQIERGRFRLDTPLRVSAYAAARPPSKIGFDPGETIEVEDAIKALVTKSANDVAVVVAEAIAGDEETFAEMMTRKARALGMRNTVFKNASGLPNREQVTTARDLTVLGRAVHDRFPRYWHYFRTQNFEYAGRFYRNHNRLLGRVEGVDGIKTGFTRASGFNLLTSARTGNRHVMAVVLGGRSGRIRDAQMANLVDEHLPSAFAGQRTAPMVAEARTEEAPVRVADAETPREPVREPAREAARETAREPVRQRVAVAIPPARPVTLQPIAPVQVEAPAQQAAVATAAPVRRAETRQPAAQAAAQAPATPVTAFAPAQAQSSAQQAPAMRWVVGRQPLPPRPVANGRSGTGRQAQAEIAPQAGAPETTASVPARATRPEPARTGWVIQLSAAENEGKARAILDQAKSRNRSVLADAEAFTEKVERGGATFYRARFAGFDDREAQAACNSLKRSGFSCFAQRI
jgi:D-alanyl-D-alanine carboxypeptidase